MRLEHGMALILALFAGGCATYGSGKNLLVSTGDAVSVPLTKGEEVPEAVADLTREIAHLLIQEFVQPKGVVESDPDTGTIELSLPIPAADRAPRTFRFYIRLQVSTANDVSVTMVPRIFAEMVNQKGSVQWIAEGPDHDLASLVSEIERYIATRTGA